MAAALGAGGGAGAGDDDFDQFDKPGAERSWRRRAADEDWDSELEDDLLGEDLLSGKKNQSDLSDEELNDDLLQSDNEDEENFSSQGVTISLNTTSGMVTSFELSDNTNDQSGEQESEYEQGEDELVYHKSDGSELYAHEYPEEGQYEGHDAELTEDHMEYVEEPEEEQLYNDEVLDIEINEPLDEFTGGMETLELQKDVKEESDEEDDEDEESGRLRFKTERKEGTIIRLSDVTRERRNIPETLELSAEAKAALLEFEERERQHKQGRYGSRRGGRRGGPVVCRGMGDQRRENSERARIKDHRPALLPTQPPGVTHSPRLIPPPQPQPPPPPPPPPQQPIRSLFQQQQLQPLLPLQHPHHASPPQGVHLPPQIEAPRVMMTPPPVTPQQPKNIHINPHFKGAVVTPVQVPLLPVPSQPRPAVGPQRFPGPPEFPQHTPGPVPSNFSQPPRLPLQDQWRAPPPPQERDPFFLGVSGEPRFPSHLFLEQRSPPPPPPPPTLLSSTHPVPTPSPLPFTQPGPAFNQQGQQPVFPRERPVRPTLQPPGPVGILHFSQPGSAATRPFIPPRQPFLPGPGQPFLPAHAQPNLQGPLHPPLPPPHQPQPQPQQQPPLQPQHQPPLQPPPQHQPPPQPPHQPQHQHHHHLSVPPPPLMPMSQPQFRPHVQTAQPPPSSGRMQCPQRQGLRHNTTSQNVTKRPMQPMQPTAPRNSNLRELPIAPSHVMEMSSSRCSSTPAAPGKPVASTSPPTRPGGGPRGAQGKSEAKVKPVSPVVQPKEEAKTEPEFPDEDEETRLYRLKIEEQKRLREEILKQKELRRQQQAGARKKELLERLAQQQQLHLPPAAAEQERPVASPSPTNGNPLLPFPGAQVRQNVKNRLLVKNQDVTVSNVQPKTSNFVPSGANLQYQGQQMKPLKHLRQARTVPQSPAQHKVLQVKPADGEGPPPPSQTARVASLQGRPPDAKPGAKRTVMHRANSGGGDGPHVSSKVRVIKLSGGQGGESDGFFHPEGQPQRLPQPPEVRQQPARKVTLTKGALQQPQHPPVGPHVHSAGPPAIKSIQGVHPAKKVLMHGRGRGVAGAMGRGRLMPNKQNLRVVECKPQPCVVSVEGLSSSTTDVQLKNLLMSVGPIQSLQMLPQQRKAIAKFKEPAHALAFQQKFHRHMIDLSHINVALIVE
ncbi:RNA-binding protein 33 isoform X4 [Ailuropoda melanoleuca]|uniref:RNA-binding protein 33 isoform X4 n=1 Tax=Ailuropoda melanoleuca TaxID=9646 RepID=UPI0014949332|nr:RNA-binding protein 33 isoform X4 [Ailuropoda melanoleuca]